MNVFVSVVIGYILVTNGRKATQTELRGKKRFSFSQHLKVQASSSFPVIPVKFLVWSPIGLFSSQAIPVLWCKLLFTSENHWVGFIQPIPSKSGVEKARFPQENWLSLCAIPNRFRSSVACSDSSLKKNHWDSHHSIIYKIPPTNDMALSLGTTSCLSVSQRYWLGCGQTSIMSVTKGTRSSSTEAWLDWTHGGSNSPRGCLEGPRELTP